MDYLHQGIRLFLFLQDRGGSIIRLFGRSVSKFKRDLYRGVMELTALLSAPDASLDIVSYVIIAEWIK
jgi:hypothetical protein